MLWSKHLVPKNNTMGRVNYKALFDAGEIRTLSDLATRFRQEAIDIYRSKVWWPRYMPGAEDLLLLRWYRYTELEEIMEFGTFCLIWKEMESSKGAGESN